MKTIYYVHDEQADPEGRVRALEACGFEVVPLLSGEALFRHLRQGKPDLVLLDVLLRGRNGFEVCRDVRSRYDETDLPVVMLSGIFRSPRFATEAESLGAQDYVAEPAALPDLVRSLMAALGEVPARTVTDAPRTSPAAETREEGSEAVQEDAATF